jgi:hypothetical protein
MSKHILTEAEMEPLLEGLAVFGTGGGGSPAFGRAIMENDLRRGREYILIDPEDVPDDALVVSGGIMGSVKAVDTVSISDIIRGWEDRFELLIALRTMERLLGKKVDYIVPFELGGLNTPVMLSLGARAGIPVINGDGLGRAAPETQMTSFLGHGISITPMPLVDSKGNIIIVKETKDPLFPDEIGRWVVTNAGAGGMGANNHYPMDGRALKSSVIPKTITKALRIGRAILQARNEGKSPIKVIEDLINGYSFLKGTIKEIEEDDRGGFLRQLVLVEGIEPDRRQVKLTIKNEVMLCQAEGREVCIFPDLILIVDPDTGRGIMSSELKVGQAISIILVPCHPRLREALEHPQGRSAFSPARFGYENLEYSPLEILVPDSVQLGGN